MRARTNSSGARHVCEARQAVSATFVSSSMAAIDPASTGDRPRPPESPNVSLGVTKAAPGDDLPASIDLSPLRLLAQNSFLAILDQIRDAKTLLLDSDLAGPLGLVCDVNSLRSHGVERMFWLDEPQASRHTHNDEHPDPVLEKDVNAPTRAVVYVCRPNLDLIRIIAGELLGVIPPLGRTK